MSSVLPTVFHITHWKAGSQWVAEILKQSAPERFVPWALTGEGMAPEFHRSPLQPGRVYGTVYLTRPEFQSLVVPTLLSWPSVADLVRHPTRTASNWWHFLARQRPFVCFVVIRDLRDTLISLYFSWKVSHHTATPTTALPAIEGMRAELIEIGEEEGLLRLIRGLSAVPTLLHVARMQTSWLDAKDVLFVRFEDLLGHDQAVFERIVDFCRINVERGRLRDIVMHNTFERVTGRTRGQEDLSAHLRKGVAGDWRNHFTPRITDEFKQRFGQTLIATGYERDLNW